MDEYISRKTLMNEFMYRHRYGMCWADVKRLINSIPAANVIPVKKFLNVLTEMGTDVYDDPDNLDYGASYGYSWGQIMRAIGKVQGTYPDE